MQRLKISISWNAGLDFYAQLEEKSSELCVAANFSLSLRDSRPSVADFGVCVFMSPLMTRARAPSCAHGHSSTRVNGVELRQRNNSFVRITSTRVRCTIHPRLRRPLITLFRCGGKAGGGLLSSRPLRCSLDSATWNPHERTPNSRRAAAKWIDLNSSLWRALAEGQLCSRPYHGTLVLWDIAKPPPPPLPPSARTWQNAHIEKRNQRPQRGIFLLNAKWCSLTRVRGRVGKFWWYLPQCWANWSIRIFLVWNSFVSSDRCDPQRITVYGKIAHANMFAKARLDYVWWIERNIAKTIIL